MNTHAFRTLCCAVLLDSENCMRRAQRRRPRLGGGGVGKAQSSAGHIDLTLRTLLVNYLALPSGSVRFVEGQVLYSAEALLYIRAMAAREQELGDKSALEAALESLTSGGAA